ncbi:MAG: hypothetical protein M3Y80_04570 [Verrucomicrobiota bacterium]|nr:hypothetical protein [Verrucomicrobiota bacterium]
MSIVLAVALSLAITGATVLRPIIDRREHLGFFLVFWAACSWFTVTALLLAAYDLLSLRGEERKASEAAARELLSSSATPRSNRDPAGLDREATVTPKANRNQ